MKNILIVAGVAAVSLYLAKSFLGGQTAQAMTSTDTKGREIIFNLNKNGFLTDQYGGIWA